MDVRHFALGLCAAITLAACADQDRPAEMGIPFDANLVGYIQPAYTAQREVVNWFGTPLAHVRMADSQGQETDNVRYAYMHGAPKGPGTSTEYLEVEFDTDGLVAGIFFAQADDGPPDM